MILNKIDEIILVSSKLSEAISSDIEDVKNANHEKLLERNDMKLELMTEISSLQDELNAYLAQAMQNGEDLNNYRESVNNLEVSLTNLYFLNGKLASIVLPVKEMYKDIIQKITKDNGGSLFEVTA
jgi:archaellum component FlaC